jgi:hypothetical protein
VLYCCAVVLKGANKILPVFATFSDFIKFGTPDSNSVLSHCEFHENCRRG